MKTNDANRTFAGAALPRLRLILCLFPLAASASGARAQDNSPGGLFREWIASHPSPGGGGDKLFDDPDGDGASNLAEYAFGSRPDDAASRPAAALRFEQAPGGAMQCVFRRRRDALSRGLRYVVEHASDLSGPDSWAEAGVAETSVSPIDEAFEEVRATPPFGDAPRGFARLRVEFAPAETLDLRPGGAPALATDALVDFRLSGANLLENGSFELGQGAEPIYPGWIQTDPSGPLDPPARPVVTAETAADGTRCLKIAGITRNQRVVLDFKPPRMGASGNAQATLALDVKSDRDTMRVIMPGSASHVVGTSWKRVSRTLQVDALYPVMRADFVNDGQQPATIYIDGIAWTADDSASDAWMRSAPVEAVLVPQRRDGIRDAGSPVVLRFVLDAASAADAEIELHLRDLTRGGAATVPWTAAATIPARPAGGEIDLGVLKPGAYMALLGVRDPATGDILAVAREKFTVMATLAGVDPPVAFATGMHGGMRGFTGQVDFCARGAWSPDEYYRTARRIGLRVQRLTADISNLMPQSDTIDLSTVKPDIDAAHRNGCSTVLCVDTFRFKNQGSAAPTGHDGDWVFAQGVKAPDNVDSPVYDFYVIPPAAIASLYGRFGAEFGGKLTALEVVNELNMYIRHDHMSWIVDNLHRPAYQAFKAAAPDTPVVVNFTMDFYLAPGYTQGFYNGGGAEGTDGFSYHPYARRILAEHLSNGSTGYGFDYMDRNNTFKAEAEAGTPKTISMGMSEIHAIGTYFTPGWDLMQRVFIDWAGGASWSAGVLSDGLYFLEAREMSAWSNRGPRAPGTGAVALNAMYGLLGGFRLVERVDLDRGVLVALFENPATGETAAALANGYYDTKDAHLGVALGSMQYRAYDQWGAEIQVSAPLTLSREILYLKSGDPGFADAFRNASLSFADAPARPAYEHDPGQFSPAPGKAWYAELLRTGLPPMQ